MRIAPLLASLLAAVAMFSPAAAWAQAKEQVRILVPAFTAEGHLGENVANVLRLQISGTFQEAETGTRALMVFKPKPLKDFTQDAAVASTLKLTTLTHMVLWGRAYRFDDGVAVQAYLSDSPFRLKDKLRIPREVWTIQVGDAPPLAVDLPRQIYTFGTIVLSPKIVATYDKVMGSLPIFEDLTFTKQIGTIQEAFRAFQYKNDAVELASGGKRGWVQLPMLWAEHTEISDFTGAYIRILRGDWQGADVLLRALLESKKEPAEIQVDTLLLLGLSREKRGLSGADQFEAAAQLNEFDAASAMYLIMSRIAETQRAVEGSTERAGALDRLDSALNRFAGLFSADNVWFTTARAAQKSLTENP